jgi:hypothetical protein
MGEVKRVERVRGAVASRVALFLLVAAWLAAGWWARHACLPYDVNNTDVGTYLFQAGTFAGGKAWRATPEPREFFQQWQAIVRERSFAYYPPLPALALALPLAAGLPPFLVPWLASGLALALAFAWIGRLAGRRAAGFGTFALAMSPFFVANGLSVLSHAFTLALAFGFLLAAERAAATGARGWLAAAGALLAAVCASRMVNALALGLAWLPWAMALPIADCRLPIEERRRRTIRNATGFAAGVVAGLVPLLLYYRALAGRWTLSLFTDYWPRNRFGFGQGLGRGEPGHFFQTYADHDFAGFLANLRSGAEGLAQWWTGNAWLSLALLAIAAWAAWSVAGRRRPGARHWAWPLLAWVALHAGLYAGYFTPSTPTTGPRYLAELMPALALATGWAFSAVSRAPRLRVAAAVAFAGVLAAEASATVHFLATNRRGIPARRAVERCVREGAEGPSLVFLRSFWIGHPLPIFLNRADLRGGTIFACDRGAEDRALVERFPDRNAYVLALAPEGRGVRVELVPIYRAGERQWLRAPESVEAPFFVGSRFTPPLRLEGETARRLFHPRPDEIEGQ